MSCGCDRTLRDVLEKAADRICWTVNVWCAIVQETRCHEHLYGPAHEAFVEANRIEPYDEPGGFTWAILDWTADHSLDEQRDALRLAAAETS